MNAPTAPQSLRAKIVYFFWNNLPRAILLLLVLLIFVLGGLIKKESAARSEAAASANKPERPAVNVVTLALSPAAIHDRINLPGSIEAWTALSLLARIGGTVQEVLVQEGQQVKDGTLLARIDSADYRIAVERARSAYLLAKADYERDNLVFAKGIIPVAEHDANRTKMETAKADLANAELQLSRCAITAPMVGLVRKLPAKVGLHLAVGDPVAEILDVGRVKAVVGIPESDVNAVRQLDSIDISLPALGQRQLSGKRHFLSASPETAARLYRLELAVENSGKDIFPGMFLRADIIKRTIPDAVVIPFYSVISRGSEQYVYVEKEGQAIKRPVTLGIMEQWMVEVKSGLHSGERLIVEGHRDVEDQQPVKVVKAASELKELTL